MNKLVIPSILTATVLIAGIFAFMPADKASTVDNTIIEAIQNSVSAQDRILYFTWTTGGNNFSSELPLVPLVVDGYSGTVNILGLSPPIYDANNNDGSDTQQFCVVSFEVNADTDNDGVGDTLVASVDLDDDSQFESAAIPDGTDQLFLDGDPDADAICSVAVTIFLDGTNT